MQRCREVAYLIASDGLEHAGWPTRLVTRLHLRMCRHCRRYAMELSVIGRAGREAGRAHSVDPKMVERLERSILDYASGGHNEGQEDVSDDGGEPTHS